MATTTKNYLTEAETQYVCSAVKSEKVNESDALLIFNYIKRTRPTFRVTDLDKAEIGTIVTKARATKEVIGTASLSKEQIYKMLQSEVKFYSIYIESIDESFTFEVETSLSISEATNLIYRLRESLPQSIYFWGGLHHAYIKDHRMKVILGYMAPDGPQDISWTGHYSKWQDAIASVKQGIQRIRQTVTNANIEHLVFKRIEPRFNPV